MPKNMIVIAVIVSCLFGQSNGQRVNLISERLTKPNTEDGTWDLWYVAHSDFDSDGIIERVEILARIERVNKSGSIKLNDFAWDDSHRWIARVIEENGDTTLIYSRLLQMSKLEGFISPNDPPRILLTEKGRGTIAVYEVEYSGPGQKSTKVLARSKFEGGFRLMDRKNNDYWPKK